MRPSPDWGLYNSSSFLIDSYYRDLFNPAKESAKKARTNCTIRLSYSGQVLQRRAPASFDFTAEISLCKFPFQACGLPVHGTGSTIFKEASSGILNQTEIFLLHHFWLFMPAHWYTERNKTAYESRVQLAFGQTERTI